MPTATRLPVPSYAPSPALSLLFRPGICGIKTRRIALLGAHGLVATSARLAYTSLLMEGAVPRIVSHHLGKLNPAAGEPLDVEISLEAGPSVLYDAVVLLDGEAAVADLARNAMTLEFIRLQHRHCKPILAIGAGRSLLDLAAIPTTFPDGSDDPAIVLADEATLAEALARFKTALAAHRAFQRETDPPQV